MPAVIRLWKVVDMEENITEKLLKPSRYQGRQTAVAVARSSTVR
jgi:hypothetical protein